MMHDGTHMLAIARGGGMDMLGCCRTAVVPGWCGSFSAHGRSGRNVPWFRGSLSGIRGFGGVLPSAVSRAFFRNRGFPTFPLGQYPQGRRIPVNSHARYGRTGANREIPTVLPHHPHTTAPIPVSPCLHRHRQPPQRRQTPPPTPTTPPTSADASADTDSHPNVNRHFCRH